MRIALAQMTPIAGALACNLALIQTALEQAASAGADLLVTPELALPGYGAGEAFAALAETRDGPSLAALQRTVESTGCALVVGFAERAADGRIFNAAAALRPGEPALIHRKIQLYGAYERQHFVPGEGDAVCFTFRLVTFGLLICFDVEFPEHVRWLARAGASVVAVPTALPDTPDSAFVATRMVPVRAFENQVFIAYADIAGHDGVMDYAGLSVIAGPDGGDLARAPADGAHLLFAEIDHDAAERSRLANPYLAELRTPCAPPRTEGSPSVRDESVHRL